VGEGAGEREISSKMDAGSLFDVPDFPPPLAGLEIRGLEVDFPLLPPNGPKVGLIEGVARMSPAKGESRGEALSALLFCLARGEGFPKAESVSERDFISLNPEAFACMFGVVKDIFPWDELTLEKPGVRPPKKCGVLSGESAKELSEGEAEETWKFVGEAEGMCEWPGWLALPRRPKVGGEAPGMLKNPGVVKEFVVGEPRGKPPSSWSSFLMRGDRFAEIFGVVLDAEVAGGGREARGSASSSAAAWKSALVAGEWLGEGLGAVDGEVDVGGEEEAVEGVAEDAVEAVESGRRKSSVEVVVLRCAGDVRREPSAGDGRAVAALGENMGDGNMEVRLGVLMEKLVEDASRGSVGLVEDAARTAEDGGGESRGLLAGRASGVGSVCFRFEPSNGKMATEAIL
jgi:hypothetical protein